ncbi:hypothetical protein E3C22_03370 [Jiella endophytica]|uniref:Uncharacterized protein n=1 Tax=Jiella endophytica TaxID=2558362 RepID=A0A4Y8RT75_9HYPH|nr:hypothetical protein [Jiella endophytica]TFF27510.1 hypothetical protein E3C22_03370 [Jiella endophytica]
MTPAMQRLERQLVAAVTQDKPRVPEAGRLLWSWFVDLHQARRYSMAGPDPISYAEIEAYARMNRLPLEPRHVAVLRKMEDAWMARARRQQSDGQQPGAAPRTSSQPLSPAMFDAVFA